MDTKSKRPKERDGILSSLNVAIEAVNLAKEVSSVTPAKAAFGSVSILLTMIKVRFLPYDEISHVHKWSGLGGQRTRIRRARAILCQHLQSPRTGDERKAIGRVQSIRVRRDKSIDDVS